MPFTERLAVLIEAHAGKAIAEFRKVGAAAHTMGGEAEAAGAQMGLMGKLGASAGNLAKAGLVAGVAGAGAAITKFAIDGVNDFTTLAGEIRKFQRATGATAEDASKLVAAFKMVGVETDVASAGLFKLARTVETNGKKLAEVGVTAARGADGNVDLVETLLRVGDAYRATTDPAKRANLVMTAFGRGGLALTPILGKTRSELEDLFASAERHHAVFTQEELNTAKDFGLATKELGAAFRGLEIEAGKALVPFLTELAKASTKTLEFIDQLGGIKLPHGADVGDVAGNAFDAINPLSGLISLYHKFKPEADKATGSLFNFGDAAKLVGGVTSETAEDFEDLEKALFSAADADRAVFNAKQSLASAIRDQSDAQRDLNELMEKTAVDAEKVADAQRSLDSATRSVGHAQREQAKAQETYNEALARFNALGTDSAQDDLVDARDNLTDANDSVADAQDRASDAQKKLTEAQAGDPDFQQKLADARQRVTDANQHIADANQAIADRTLAAIKAHDLQTKALSDDADQAARLESHLRGIVAISPEVAPALAGPLAALAGVTAPTAGALGGGSFLDRAVAIGARTASPLINQSTAPKNVTVNQTFNTPVDPIQVAKNLQWAMN